MVHGAADRLGGLAELLGDLGSCLAGKHLGNLLAREFAIGRRYALPTRVDAGHHRRAVLGRIAAVGRREREPVAGLGPGAHLAHRGELASRRSST